MKFDPLGKPELSGSRGDEMFLSRGALLELMTAVLSKGCSFRFKAKGWSMTPFIRDGDVIKVDPINAHPLQVGQVVAFHSADERCLVVHRIIARTDTGYLIQGDSAMGESDGIVRQDQLLGQVSRVDREGRRVWLGQGPGRGVVAWLSRRGHLARLRMGWNAWVARIRKLLSK